jgi:hypothetical protein
MIVRRALLLAGAGLIARPAATASPIPPDSRLAFRMIRHDNDIGRHVLTFERRDDTLTVRVAVDAKVSFLSIPLVRYTHRLVETWHGGTLVSLVGQTDKNGDREWVNAQRNAEGLLVRGSATEPYIAPESAISVSYWNKRLLDGPMIGTEDGTLLRPKVTPPKPETIPLASGGAITADHYNLSGPFSADVWYDHADTWASLAFAVADGSVIHYERL